MQQFIEKRTSELTLEIKVNILPCQSNIAGLPQMRADLEQIASYCQHQRGHLYDQDPGGSLNSLLSVHYRANVSFHGFEIVSHAHDLCRGPSLVHAQLAKQLQD